MDLWLFATILICYVIYPDLGCLLDKVRKIFVHIQFVANIFVWLFVMGISLGLPVLLNVNVSELLVA